jgi:photosystem II stability/assembly factor-like uncharacterized protein
MNKTENVNPIIFVTMLTTRKHLLGIKNPPVGIFYGNGFNGLWSHIGLENARISTITIDEKSDGRIMYAASGSGVLKSDDYGKNWAIITGYEITEALKVEIDPRNSKILYAATAYGIFKSIDGGKKWIEKNKGKKTKHTSRIIFDKSRQKRILIACEDGIYYSKNGAESWSLLGLEDKGIRYIAQHPKNTDLFVIGTEDDGIFISSDCGKTFIQKNEGLNHKTVYSVALDPDDPKIMYCATYEGGVYKSVDGGDTWIQKINGFTEPTIHSLAVYTLNSDIIFAGSINGGLFRSDDAGENWKDISTEALEMGQIGDIYIFNENLVKTKPAIDILTRKYSQNKYDHDFKSRRAYLFEFLSENFETSGIYSALSRLILGKNVAKAYQQIDEILDAGKVQGMLLAHQLITMYLHCHKYLPERIKAKIRDKYKTYFLTRGDTENHWLLYYSSLYLAAEVWPNLPATEWFNGKSSKENHDEAEKWIEFWMQTATTIGQGEFDSPTYHPTFLSPLFLLLDFAKDKKMRQKSQIMLDFLMADFAVDHLKGFYCGGHSRDYPIPHNVTNPITAPISTWAYLFFGQISFPYESRDFGLLFLPIMSNYHLPEIIYKIGTDRNTPYVHTDTRRVRNIFRFGTEMNPPVYKYIYMTKNYALGSLHGGILQPIQQHTWDITFINDRPYNTIFCLHPYSSPRELGMFFPEAMKLMVDEVHKYHKIYKSPDKWGGCSPYEQTFQHKNAIIVLYNIKEGELFGEIDGHFPKALDERICDESGWIFCKAGKTFIAYFPLKPYIWVEEGLSIRLRSQYLKNGCILEAASEDDFEGDDPFKTFMQKILQNKIEKDNFDEKLNIKYTTLSGDDMEFTYDGERIINGKKVDFKDYKFFNGPYLYSEMGSQKLTITYGKSRRILDYKKLAIKEEKAGK